jgi:hypothetical protein
MKERKVVVDPELTEMLIQLQRITRGKVLKISSAIFLEKKKKELIFQSSYQVRQ